MYKKLFSIVLVAVMVLMLPGCGKDKELKANGDKVTTKKAEITVYLPEGQQLDNKYYKDKDIAINYLPNNKGDFTEKEVNDIANNIDKHVKVLIITTEKSGLEDVFKKVKEKLPGVITVAGDIGEMHNKKFYSVLKNSDIDAAFIMENGKKGVISAQIAKMMGADKYIYVNSVNSADTYIDTKDTKLYCSENGMKFEKITVDKNESEKAVLEKIKKTAGDSMKNTAVYPADRYLSETVLKGAMEYGYMVPNINSDNDGRVLAKLLNLEDEYKELPREEFDLKVSEKLKKYNLDGKVAGISEGIYSIPSELSIEISKYMYEKDYMIEECYADKSAQERSNRMLKLPLEVSDFGVSSPYARNLIVSPRIY